MLTHTLCKAYLIFKGGQFYWPDETRYLRSFTFLFHLKNLDAFGILQFLGYNLHNGYTLMGLPAAITQLLLCNLAGVEIWQDIYSYIKAGSLVNSLYGTFCIILTYAITRRLGGAKTEANLCAFLLACSPSIYVWSRHMVPYDASLTLLLLSFYWGISWEYSVKRAILVSLISAVGFYTYYGYWQLAFILPAFATLIRNMSEDKAVVIKRCLVSIVTTIGFCGIFLATALIVQLKSLSSIERILEKFSESSSGVVQGDFGLGWKMIGEWVWHTEKQLVLPIVLSIFTIGYAYIWLKERPSRNTLLIIMLCTCTLFLIIAASDIFMKFVTYGRTCKVLIALLCIACPLSIGINKLKLSRAPIILCIVFSSISFLFQSIHRQSEIIFPYEYESSIFKKYGNLKRDSTLPANKHLKRSKETIILLRRYPYLHRTSLPHAKSDLKLYNAQMLYPIGINQKMIAPDSIIQKVKHPINCIYYQFEGTNNDERAFIRKSPIEMMLISTSN